MIRKIQFCSIALVFASVSTLSSQSMDSGSSQKSLELLNIYDESLQSCGTSQMRQGSWDQQYKCSEEGGGVHQICIEKIASTTNKFSLNTGQTDWSTQRGNDNHCVCLGAWSLYVARKNKNQISDEGKRQLKCDAIPKMALTKEYVKNFSKKQQYFQGWERWNGLELENQIVDGVNELFRQCSQTSNQSQLKALIKNYCSFAEGISSVEDSETYIKNCKASTL